MKKYGTKGYFIEVWTWSTKMLTSREKMAFPGIGQKSYESTELLTVNSVMFFTIALCEFVPVKWGSNQK